MTMNTLRDRYPVLVRLLVVVAGGTVLLLCTEDLSGRVGGLAALSALLLVRHSRALPDLSETTRGQTTTRQVRRGLPDVRFTWSLSTGWQMRVEGEAIERPARREARPLVRVAR